MPDIKAMAVEAGIDDSAPLTPYMLQRLEVFARAVAVRCIAIIDNQPGGLNDHDEAVCKAIAECFGLDE